MNLRMSMLLRPALMIFNAVFHLQLITILNKKAFRQIGKARKSLSHSHLLFMNLMMNHVGSNCRRALRWLPTRQRSPSFSFKLAFSNFFHAFRPLELPSAMRVKGSQRIQPKGTLGRFLLLFLH
jgi:hypothetical protein